MDIHMLGVHHRPATLGLDPPHGGVGVGSQVAHAVAMWRLVEAVLGGDRTDSDGLEQDIVARISGHDRRLPPCNWMVRRDASK